MPHNNSPESEEQPVAASSAHGLHLGLAKIYTQQRNEYRKTLEPGETFDTCISYGDGSVVAGSLALQESIVQVGPVLLESYGGIREMKSGMEVPRSFAVIIELTCDGSSFASKRDLDFLDRQPERTIPDSNFDPDFDSQHTLFTGVEMRPLIASYSPVMWATDKLSNVDAPHEFMDGLSFIMNELGYEPYYLNDEEAAGMAQIMAQAQPDWSDHF